MSIRRWAARVDTTQKEIVAALRAAGYQVELIRKPVDLAVRHPRWPLNRWMFAEAKTLEGTKTKRVYARAKSKKQTDFCINQGIPLWTSAEQALKAVGEVT